MSPIDSCFLPPAPDGKRPILHIRGGWSVEVDSMIFDQGIDHLRVEWWDSENLNPLRKHAALLKKLWIECEVSDVTAVNECVNLVDLGLMRTRSKIDFKRLKNLNKLSLDGQAICSEIAACPNLRTLTVTGASNTNLKELAESSGLRQLCLRESKLTTIEGIERLTKLQSLTLSQLPLQSLDGLDKLDALCDLSLCCLRKLVSLDPIRRIHKLKKLDITSCHKIENMDIIWELTGLKELILENMKITDVGFLAPLKFLERLFLAVGTRVNDGDLSVLLTLPKLKDIIFSNRQHYSHKLAEIRQIIEERGR